MRKKVLILAGAPGAGKGTIKQKIMQIWEKEGKTFSNLETSAILKKDTKFQEIMARGDLVKDEDVICALHGPLQTAKENIMLDNIILDGFPRTIMQGMWLQRLNWFEFKILKLEANEEDIIQRVLNRRICPNCNATYNLLTKELRPIRDGFCDKCNSELVIRKDDAEIKKRLIEYHSKTEETIEYLKKERMEYYEIDSNNILTEGFIEDLLKEMAI